MTALQMVTLVINSLSIAGIGALIALNIHHTISHRRARRIRATQAPRSTQIMSSDLTEEHPSMHEPSATASELIDEPATVPLTAGMLTAEHMGQAISITYVVGRIESTVVDVVRAVTHDGTHDGLPVKTTLRFENQQWHRQDTNGATLFSTMDLGLVVDPSTPVLLVDQVRSES